MFVLEGFSQYDIIMMSLFVLLFIINLNVANKLKTNKHFQLVVTESLKQSTNVTINLDATSDPQMICAADESAIPSIS